MNDSSNIPECDDVLLELGENEKLNIPPNSLPQSVAELTTERRLGKSFVSYVTNYYMGTPEKQIAIIGVDDEDHIESQLLASLIKTKLFQISFAGEKKDFGKTIGNEQEKAGNKEILKAKLAHDIITLVSYYMSQGIRPVVLLDHNIHVSKPETGTKPFTLFGYEILEEALKRDSDLLKNCCIYSYTTENPETLAQYEKFALREKNSGWMGKYPCTTTTTIKDFASGMRAMLDEVKREFLDSV